MPPTLVPSVARVAAKWARRAGNAASEYEDGVRSSTRDWATASVAGENNYKAGVTAAAGAGRYGKGIARVGNAKWKKGAIEKGPARFSQGVAVAEGEYSQQMAPFLEAIGRVDLPPRGPAGSEANYGRVSAIGKALRQLKTSR
jgi:hypothetical protein